VQLFALSFTSGICSPRRPVSEQEGLWSITPSLFSHLRRLSCVGFASSGRIEGDHGKFFPGPSSIDLIEAQ
jgi:hypothetical protein